MLNHRTFYIILIFFALSAFYSCKDKSENDPEPVVPETPETPNEVPGLAFDAWAPKTAMVPSSYTDVSQTSAVKNVDVTVNFSKRIAKISKYLYGHNANCYTGWMQDDATLMQKIKNLNMGVMRIPGGSISDVYFWNRKGVYENYAIKSYEPALTDIPSTISPWAGKRVESFESWSMGVDQYYKMMQFTGATGIVTVNYGYARYGTSSKPVEQAAHLAAEWVRHDNGRSKFWEIGNECFGSWEAGYEIDQSLNKDGQPKRISGDLYGKHCLVFIDSMKNAAKQIGKDIYIGAVCFEQSTTDMPNWNKEVIAQVGGKADFYIIHSYFTPFQGNSAPDVILNSPAQIRNYKSYLHTELESQGKPLAPIFLTEWNIFAEGSKQAVSYINGMHAALVLGETMKNQYGLAVRWDLANGWSNGNDHGLFSTGEEPGVTRYTARPAFYYMYYFQKYFGDIIVETESTNLNVIAYASQFNSGEGGIVLVNKNTYERVVELTLKNYIPGTRYYTYTLTGGTDNGNFSRKVYVNGVTTTQEGGGPENYETLKPVSSSIKGKIKVTLPKYSVVYILVEKGV